MNPIKIRIAKETDADELLKIYAPYVKQTSITFEYEVPSLEEFTGRIRNVNTKFPYLVAESNDEILGYAYVSPFKTRAAYQWAVETSIYVKMDQKRAGIGSKLYDTLETILKEQGVLNMNACIAYPKTEDDYLTKDSVAFHKKLGYEMVGEFHNCGYKFNRWYDMVWMEKQIGDHVSNQPKVKSFDEIKGRFPEL